MHFPELKGRHQRKNMLYSGLKMSFLSNFKNLLEKLIVPTDLLESNMTFFLSVLSVSLRKKETLDLLLRKAEKRFCE